MSLFRYVGEDKADVQLDFKGFTMMKQLSARCLEVKHEGSDTSIFFWFYPKKSRYEWAPTTYQYMAVRGVSASHLGWFLLYCSRQQRLPKNLPQYDVPKTLRQCALYDTQQLQYENPFLDKVDYSYWPFTHWTVKFAVCFFPSNRWWPNLVAQCLRKGYCTQWSLLDTYFLIWQHEVTWDKPRPRQGKLPWSRHLVLKGTC